MFVSIIPDESVLYVQNFPEILKNIPGESVMRSLDAAGRVVKTQGAFILAENSRLIADSLTQKTLSRRLTPLQSCNLPPKYTASDIVGVV